MSQNTLSHVVTPGRLLIIATVTPLLGALIGYQLGEHSEAGMLVGVALMFAFVIAALVRTSLDRRWALLAALPVLFWGGSLLWFITTSGSA